MLHRRKVFLIRSKTANSIKISPIRQVKMWVKWKDIF